MKVISGGQTGVDQAALRAARACGIETGGWAPKGWLTEDGPAPWLADYGLVEHASDKYPPRTEANVRDSDATLLIGNPWSEGSLLALRMIIRFSKPRKIISRKHAGESVEVKTRNRLNPQATEVFTVDEPNAYEVWQWIVGNQIHTLNVAGNRESANPGIGKAAEAFLAEVFIQFAEEQAK